MLHCTIDHLRVGCSVLGRTSRAHRGGAQHSREGFRTPFLAWCRTTLSVEQGDSPVLSNELGCRQISTSYFQRLSFSCHRQNSSSGKPSLNNGSTGCGDTAILRKYTEVSGVDTWCKGVDVGRLILVSTWYLATGTLYWVSIRTPNIGNIRSIMSKHGSIDHGKTFLTRRVNGEQHKILELPALPLDWYWGASSV